MIRSPITIPPLLAFLYFKNEQKIVIFQLNEKYTRTNANETLSIPQLKENWARSFDTRLVAGTLCNASMCWWGLYERLMLGRSMLANVAQLLMAVRSLRSASSSCFPSLSPTHRPWPLRRCVEAKTLEEISQQNKVKLLLSRRVVYVRFSPWASRAHTFV